MTTYEGTVTAASTWGGHAARMDVRPGLPGSVEELFHHVGAPRFGFTLRDLGEAAGALDEARLHRAIGVIHRPHTERQSHYVHARLPRAYDAILHVDETTALEALAPLAPTPPSSSRRAA